MLTTAGRDVADYNREWTTIGEVWDDQMEDLVFENTDLLWVLFALGRMSFQRGGEYNNRSAMGSKNNTFEAFQGTQQFTVEEPSGPVAASWQFANYKMSLMQTWHERIAHSGAAARLDSLQHDMDQLHLSFGENLNIVLQEGQGNGSLHIEGLEDAIFAATTTSGTEPYKFTDRSQAVAGTYNTYAGFDRTASDTAAVGARNLSFDLDENGSSAGDDTFALGSNCMKVFRRSKDFLTRGKERPDLCLMSIIPFDDFREMLTNGSSPLIRFEAMSMGDGGVREFNLGIETLKYENMIIIKVDGLEYSTVGGSSDPTDGTGIIYQINTDTWEIVVEEEAYFSWTPWIPASLSLYSVAHNVLRFLVKCMNPRKNSVIFNYNN